MRFAGLLSLAALALGLSACSGGSTTPGPPPGTNPSRTYTMQATVAVPNVPPPSGTWSFDISFVDPIFGQYYLADRTNAGIDVISTVTRSFVGVAAKGSFVGLAAAGSNFSGPNGVASIGGGNLMAGDGNSTIKVVNVNGMSLVATINAVNPYTGQASPDTDKD